MTDSIGDASQDPDQIPAKFERWAARLFAVLVGVVSVATFAALIGGRDLPPGAIALALVGVPVGVAVLLTAIWGLGEMRPWARPLAHGILWILVIAGVAQFVAALGTGLHIPLEAIAAAFVLRTAREAPRRAGLTSRDQWIALGLTALFLGSTVWPVASDAALQSGVSPFAVGPEAMDLSVAIDCGGAATEDGIRVTITWAWRDRDIWPGSTDGLFVGWTSDIGDEVPYFDQGASTWPAGVRPGEGSPASTLIQPLRVGWFGGFAANTGFGIDVRSVGQIDGQIEVVLRPSADQHGNVMISAAYAHLDRWLLESDGVGCSW